MRKTTATKAPPRPRDARPPIDPTEAGKYIGGASHWTMRRLAASGRVSSIKLGGRLFFDPDELDRYIAEGTRPRRLGAA